ncbi:MAG: DUF2612 domain-containing protein [Elusimicrobiota bacterium]|nr:DUF2612 domain-containing protein [Elusimicrobiota bacterium]
MKIYNLDYNLNLFLSILWQYDNAKKLKAIFQKQQNFYDINVKKFLQDWFDNVFNLQTASSFGLSVWGKILDIERPTYQDSEGNIINYNDNQYRLLLKSVVIIYNMPKTLESINDYLDFMFSHLGDNYVIDLNNMEIKYVLSFFPTSEELVVLYNPKFLPKPAGVKLELIVLNDEETFGFNDSEMQPFNQGTFLYKV